MFLSFELPTSKIQNLKSKIAMSNQNAIFMQPGEGSSSWVLGDLYTFKANSEET